MSDVHDELLARVRASQTALAAAARTAELDILRAADARVPKSRLADAIDGYTTPDGISKMLARLRAKHAAHDEGPPTGGVGGPGAGGGGR